MRFLIPLITGVISFAIFFPLGMWHRRQLQHKREAEENGLSVSEVKSIHRGLRDVEAGRTKPLEQVRAEMRERERIRARQVCSDKSHWND